MATHMHRRVETVRRFLMRILEFMHSLHRTIAQRLSPFNLRNLDDCCTLALAMLILFMASRAMADDYAKSLEIELQAGLERVARDAANPNLLIKIATLYLDLGDEVYDEKQKRLVAYEQGAGFAMRALEMRETSAEAHFLYAANLGSAAQLKGRVASAGVVQTLKRHLQRALELQSDHAPALHMMGVMLDELPWFLGGDRKAALESVKRAVTVDPNYASARLDLAKMYLKRKDTQSARRELSTLVDLQDPHGRHAWAARYRPEGLRLLEELGND